MCSWCWTLFGEFGATHAEVDAMLRDQQGRCAICRTDRPGAADEWCIDHDHVTGHVRGLLCGSCNLAIGLLKDDPTVLDTAANYIRIHCQR